MSVTALQILLAKIQLLCVLVDCLLPLKLDHLSLMVSTTVFAACPRGKGALPFWLGFKGGFLKEVVGKGRWPGTPFEAAMTLSLNLATMCDFALGRVKGAVLYGCSVTHNSVWFEL